MEAVISGLEKHHFRNHKLKQLVNFITMLHKTTTKKLFPSPLLPLYAK